MSKEESTVSRRGGDRDRVAPAGSGRHAAGGGILKFYTDDAPGIKVGPTTVLILSLLYMGIVVVLHILAKVKLATMGGGGSGGGTGGPGGEGGEGGGTTARDEM